MISIFPLDLHQLLSQHYINPPVRRRTHLTLTLDVSLTLGAARRGGDEKPFFEKNMKEEKGKQKLAPAAAISIWVIE